jgi:hypothetical protein
MEFLENYNAITSSKGCVGCPCFNTCLEGALLVNNNTTERYSDLFVPENTLELLLENFDNYLKLCNNRDTELMLLNKMEEIKQRLDQAAKFYYESIQKRESVLFESVEECDYKDSCCVASQEILELFNSVQTEIQGIRSNF